MTRGWLIAVAVIGLGLAGQPAGAQEIDLLYRVQRSPGSNLTPPPGTAIAGLSQLRRLTSPAEGGTLTIPERRTLQPNVIYRALFTPNDPQFPLQWNLNVIHVPAAWDADQTPPLYGGDPHIVVAVLDTGLASTLVGGAKSVPDIASGAVWTNPGEIAGDGIDNDGNGYVDDVHGWNFVSNDAAPADDNGHGTHISSIITATTNNAVATAGIAANVTIMPLKVLDDNGDGSTATLTAAVNYAVKHGANIINLSLGGDQDDPIFHQAIQTAVQQGVVVVGAAGNSGAGAVTYPARYSEVIGVGAVQVDLTRAPYSNYGSTLDLVAPGGNISLDQNADGQPDGIPSQTCVDAACASFNTMFYVGTSQAAAHVSGVAALLESCGAVAGSVRTILTSTAQDLSPAGRDDQSGYGLIDAAAALNAAGCQNTVPSPPSAISGTASATARLPLVSQRPSPYINPVFAWSGPAGAVYNVTWRRGSTVVKQNRQTATTYQPKLSSAGVYNLVVATVDAVSRTSAPSTFTYRYRPPLIVASTGTTITLYGSAAKPVRVLQPRIAAPSFTVAGGVLATDQSNRLLVTAQPQGPTVTITDTSGRRLGSVQPFGAKFNGTINTAVLQLADGTSRFVAATATNGASLAWYTTAGKLTGRNLVYGAYRRGLDIAAGDLDGDGNDELIAAQTAGADIRVYDARRQRTATFTPRGPTFKQGWSVTAGDTDGDGRAEIMATPNVAIKLAKILVLSATGVELRSWKIKGLTGAGSLDLQAIDLDGDGLVELLTAPRSGPMTIQRWTAAGKLLQRLTVPSTAANSLSRL